MLGQKKLFRYHLFHSNYWTGVYGHFSLFRNTSNLYAKQFCLTFWSIFFQVINDMHFDISFSFTYTNFQQLHSAPSVPTLKSHLPSTQSDRNQRASHDLNLPICRPRQMILPSPVAFCRKILTRMFTFIPTQTGSCTCHRRLDLLRPTIAHKISLVRKPKLASNENCHRRLLVLFAEVHSLFDWSTPSVWQLYL